MSVDIIFDNAITYLSDTSGSRLVILCARRTFLNVCGLFGRGATGPVSADSWIELISVISSSMPSRNLFGHGATGPVSADPCIVLTSMIS